MAVRGADPVKRASERQAGVARANAPCRPRPHAGSATRARTLGWPQDHAEVRIRPRRPQSGERERCSLALPAGHGKHGERCAGESFWLATKPRGGDPGAVNRSGTAMGAVGKRRRPDDIADKVSPSTCILSPLSLSLTPCKNPSF
jgi:hypothetical protein